MLGALKRLFSKPETRGFVDQPLSRAWEPARVVGIDQLAALEAACGLYGRGFASAVVSGPTSIKAALNAPTLVLIGRELIRRGEVLFEIRVDAFADGLRLVPASSWTVTSTSPDPRDWTYFVETNGPTGSEFRRVPSAAVIHIRYSVDPRSPWRGVAPLGWAKEAAELSASVDQSLRAELNEVVAHLIGIEPSSPSPDPSLAEIQAIQEALGARRFQSLYPRSRRVPESVETPTAAFGIPSFLTRKTSVSRIGPSIPASSVGLKTEASEAVFTALGIPLPLVSGAEGTAAREAWRRFASGCLEPLGRLAATELSEKLDAEIGISFERLFAADLSGRARAFQSLVGGGMSPKKATRLAGLMGAED